jgi:peptide/nickel transport system substrate-binding protein
MSELKGPSAFFVCCSILFLILICCVPVSAGIPCDTTGDGVVSEDELSTGILNYLNATYAAGPASLDKADLSLAAHNTLHIPYGQLVVAVDSENELLPRAYIDEKGVPEDSLIYEGFVTRARDKEDLGWLASSWEHSADGKAWTFHIPSGSTWQDGVPVTANDAVFSYRYINDKGLKNRNVLSHVTNVTALNNTTVVYSLDICMPQFPDLLATGPGIAIFPEHIWSSISNPNKESDPDYIGSGPFLYNSSISGDSYKLEAYRGYHGSVPYVNTIVRKLYSSEDIRVLALKNGDVDFVSDLAPATAQSLQGVNGIGVTTIPAGGKSFEVAFNLDIYPANNTLFREALSHAVNRDRMCQLIDRQATEATNTAFLIPALAGDQVNNATNDRYDYDLTTAKALLAQAGFTLKTENRKNVLYGPDNQVVTITIPLGGKASTNGIDEKIVQVLKEDWETDLGITLTVENLKADDDQYDKRIDGDAVRIDGMPSYFHDDIARLNNFQSSPLGKNYYHFDNGTFNELIDTLQNTVEESQRKAIGNQLQEILVEQIPCIPVCSMDAFDAYRSDRFYGFDSLIHKDGGDINIFSHVKPASTEVNR